VKTAEQEFGKIDILFNNAGICAYGLAHELTENEWDVMLDINLKGAVDGGKENYAHHD
jgi:NADP-dependent 3-hydroxy acid dehydrogenase YdfG